jgi:hypothetical protein
MEPLHLQVPIKLFGLGIIVKYLSLIAFFIPPDMDGTSLGHGLEQGGFAGSILADKEGNGFIEDQGFRLIENFQLERIAVPGWKGTA